MSKPMNQEQLDALARKRAKVIMAVRGGQMTAKEGAQELGVSRKTYYKWERRALEGMVSALEDCVPGRPEERTDPEKEELLRKNRNLEAKLESAKQSDFVRKILQAMEDRKREAERVKATRSKKNRKLRKKRLKK